MSEHGVASVKKEGRVVTVTCKCHASFDSLESEALAKTYLKRHILHVAKKEMSR